MTRILVGVDGSEGALVALRWACREANTYRNATVVAAAVWMAPTAVTSPWTAGYADPIDLSQPTAEMLDAAVAALGDRPRSFTLEQRVIHGASAPALLDEADRCDLIVVGTRGFGGFKGLLLGSVSHHIVMHARCPVVVVPHRERDEPPTDRRPIVVGVDGSDNSIAALQWAARRAGATHSTIRAILAWRPPHLPLAPAAIASSRPTNDAAQHSAARALDNALSRAKLSDDIAVEQVTVEGQPAQTLIDEARDADLLVVGARGREGFFGLLLGSVATAVTHHPPCAVAVIRNY